MRGTLFFAQITVLWIGNLFPARENFSCTGFLGL